MTYYLNENRIGGLPIAAIDTGVPYVLPGGAAAVRPKSPTMLGSIVRAVDTDLGEGEFICLKGVAGTVIGSCVVWDATFATTLAAAAAATSGARPVAFAMAANVSPNTFGWYQISGNAIAAKDTGAAVNPNSPIAIASAGAVGPSAAGLEIEGARSTNGSTVLAATPTLPIFVSRPTVQGRIT
jgi:hypothetical protein